MTPDPPDRSDTTTDHHAPNTKPSLDDEDLGRLASELRELLRVEAEKRGLVLCELSALLFHTPTRRDLMVVNSATGILGALTRRLGELAGQVGCPCVARSQAPSPRTGSAVFTPDKAPVTSSTTADGSQGPGKDDVRPLRDSILFSEMGQRYGLCSVLLIGHPVPGRPEVVVLNAPPEFTEPLRALFRKHGCACRPKKERRASWPGGYA